jgi:hypothetical protein
VLAGSTGGTPLIGNFNGDNTSDVGLVKTANPNDGLLRVLLMQGLVIANSGFPALLAADFEATGAGNFNGDANDQSEILVRKLAGANAGLVRIIVLNAAGTGVASNAFPAVVSSDYRLIGVGDLDNDGNDDLAYIKTNAPNQGLVRVLLLNANLTVKSNGFPSLLTGYSGLGVADANGDGRADIFAIKTGAPNQGLVRILVMGATGLTVDSNQFPTIKPATLNIEALAFNNADSRADIVMRNPTTGLVRIARVGPNAASIESNAFPAVLGVGFEVVGGGDFDGLNQSDVLARQSTGANTGLLRIVLLNAAGDGVSNAGFPANPGSTFAVIQNEEP